MSTEDTIRYLIAQKRRARRWRMAWVWTFGALLLAVVAIEALVFGRLTL